MYKEWLLTISFFLKMCFRALNPQGVKPLLMSLFSDPQLQFEALQLIENADKICGAREEDSY